LSISKKIKAYLLKKFTKKISQDIEFKDIKSVLFLRYDRIGDMIISTPVFRELKKVRPDIKIAVLASKAGGSVIKYNPYVDEIYYNDKHNSLLDDYMMLKPLANKYDCIVEFDHSVVPHAIARINILKPKKVISTYKDGRYGVRGDELKLYDHYTPNNLDRHFKDIWLETVSFFGVNNPNSKYDIFTPATNIAKEFVSQFDDKFVIAINLEGSVKGKFISQDKLKEIVTKLKEKIDNLQIIILHTPDKRDSIISMIDEFGLDYILPSYKTNSILDVTDLIKEVDFVITPDTSIVHIASACDKPQVSIHENNIHSYTRFGPTSTLSKTVFAKSENGLEGYSVDEIVEYTLELKSKINN
jgi:ADP-heptose:LPS heptosyltransferase